jgi:hypothetical protein
MKNVHDQLAKALLRAVLPSGVRMETNREIPGHILEADIWLEPGSEEQDLAMLGVLGRMVGMGPCLMEPFSGVPRASDIRSCILKQYSLDHAQQRDARTGGGSPAPAFPVLWVMANGSPDSVMEAMDLQPMKGWPSGFYQGPPFDAFHLAVIRRLPETPETLLLRLLGRGETFQGAIRELAAANPHVPALAEIAEAVLQVLVVFRRDLDQHEYQEEDDMEASHEVKAAYEEWKRQVRHEGSIEGRREGKREGLLEMLQVLCAQHGVELTDERRAQMNGMDAAELERTIVAVSTMHEWPE